MCCRVKLRGRIGICGRGGEGKRGRWTERKIACRERAGETG